MEIDKFKKLNDLEHDLAINDKSGGGGGGGGGGVDHIKVYYNVGLLIKNR